jgi:hypothetical protein
MQSFDVITPENSISYTELFLSKDNQKALISSLYSLHLKHGFDMPITYFYKWVPIKMNQWARIQNLDNFECLGSGIDDYVAALQHINRKFIRAHQGEAVLETSLHNEIVDIQMPANEIQLTTHKADWEDDEFCSERKPLKSLLASDYGLIDVWTSMDVTSGNDRYRKKNRLNLDQISRHARPYDRENATEGLRATIDNSSYTNHHQRGFGLIYQEYINNMTDDKNRHFYL